MYSAQLADAANVIGDTSTSSPSPAPAANIAPCSAPVPFGERHHVGRAEVLGQRVLEALHRRALGDQLGAQRLHHRVDVGLRDLLAAVREEVGGHATGATPAAISRSSSTPSHDSFVSLE